VLVWSLAALAAAIVCPVAGVAAAPSVVKLPGVPPNTSLLFAINFASGTLTPDHRAGAGHYVLTLSGLPRTATWFSDRPQRDAGRVSVRRLLGSWRALGFAAVAPNAAVVVDHAAVSRDTMAVELYLRSFDRRTATARFAVRALGSLGHGLASLNRRLDPRLARHFSAGALFIDNATYGPTCTLGQPQLMAIAPSLLYHRALTGLLPANGQLLPINSSTNALFAIYGARFGGDGKTTFGLPNMAAPSGATWFICSSGVFPTTASMGACTTGQINDLVVPGGPAATVTDPDWLPADGRTIAASAAPDYANAYAPGPAQITLPSVTAPPGMRAYVCVAAKGSQFFYDIAQVDLFPGDPGFIDGWGNFGPGWVLANGQSLPLYWYAALSSLVGAYSYNSFSVPSIPAPASGTSWWIAANGFWALN
jgi:microcystin-dependent protein